MPRDTDDFIAREFLGRPRASEPSPGPWSVKEHREHNRLADRTETTWIILDANSKLVAECERWIDAIHITQNCPRPAATPGETGGGK